MATSSRRAKQATVNSERIRSIERLLSFCALHAYPYELRQALHAELVEQTTAAIAHLPNLAFTDRVETGWATALDRLKDALMKGSITSVTADAESRDIAMFLGDTLDKRTETISQLGHLIESHLELPDRDETAVDGDLLNRAVGHITAMHQQSDSDRVELLETGIALTSRAVADRDFEDYSALWLHLAWMYRQQGQASYAAAVMAADKAVATWPSRDADGTILAVRHAAHYRFLIGDAKGALQCVSQVLGRHTDAELAVDALRYAAATNAPIDVGTLVGRIFESDPFRIVEILADPTLAQSSRILESLGGLPETLCKLTKEGLHSWLNLLSKIGDAERVCGASFQIPRWHKTDLERWMPRALELDPLSASIVIQRSSESYRAAVSQAEASLRRLRRDAEERLRLAQEDMDMALKHRDLDIERASEHWRQTESKVREAYADSDEQGGKIEQGCSIGLAVGLSALILHLCASALGGIIGWTPSASSPVVVFAWTLIAIPIGVTMLLQMAYALKRTALDAEMRSKMEKAQKNYELAVNLVNRGFKSHLPTLREHLSQAQANLDVILQAQAAFDGKGGESQVAKPMSVSA